MTVASRLGMSLQRCQQETTATEFIKWLSFIREEKADEEKSQWERTQKWEYYAARLIATVKSVFQKGVREQDEIIMFKMTTAQEKHVTKEERVKEAKSFWSSFFATCQTVHPMVGKKGKRSRN